MLALVILSILLTWILCAGVCIGVGALLLRAFRLLFSPLDAFWSGVALIAAVLQLFHFFRPIDLFVDAFLFVLGAAGWLVNRRLLLEHLRGLREFQLPAMVLYLPTVVFIAFRAAAPCEHYDTGFYGATAIRWITTYRVIPGLGNLLPQLGFNSSIHLWMAALGQGPWRTLAHHLFVSFMVAAFFAHVIPAGVRVFRGNDVSALDWFLTLLFVPAAIWAATGKISGADTDLPTSMVLLVAAAAYFRAVDVRNSGIAGENRRQLSLIVAMLLFSLAIVFKLSSLVFAGLGWSLAALKLWRGQRENPRERRLVIGAALLCAALVLPWIARGLILTGYPLFPSTALSIRADWKVPAASAQYQADTARSFARIPAVPIVGTSGFRWLRPWFRELIRQREGFLIPLFFALAGIAACILRGSREKRTALPPWFLLLLPSLAGLIFWFAEAPAVRFGEPAIWTMGATLGTLAALRFLDQSGKRRLAVIGLLLLTVWAVHPRLFWGSHIRPSLSVRTLLPLPQPKLMRRQTASGLTVYVPLETDQCWDAPLPCTGYFNGTLRLRRPGDVSGGFASEGLPTDIAAPPLWPCREQKLPVGSFLWEECALREELRLLLRRVVRRGRSCGRR